MSILKLKEISKIELFWFVLYILLIWLYSIVVSAVNADLLVGRFALFMDERITYDGVYKILNAGNLNDFIWNIFDGGDHRYGRSLWNVMALFSMLPESIFGVSGQIFAGRMVQVALLISAFVLFSITFARHWFFRFILLSSLLALPYTSYFMTIPKPEPLQMLFIAVFFFLVHKDSGQMLGKKWIFLGLAFGSKISTLPVIPVVIAFTIVSAYLNKEYKYDSYKVFLSLCFFMIGLGVAEPILLFNSLSSVILLALVYFFIVQRFFQQKSLMTTALLSVTLILTILAHEKIIHSLENKSGIEKWVNSTFKNTGHGADSIDTGFMSWISYYFKSWMDAPFELSVILICLAFLFLAYFVYIIVRKGQQFQFYILPVTAIVSGLALLFSIFLNVHRLWGFYLFPGMILFISGLICLMEAQLFLKSKQAGLLNVKLNISGKVLASTLLIILVTYPFYWWPSFTYHKYLSLANRTESSSFKEKYESYKIITRFLDEFVSDKDKMLLVAYDPHLYLPDSNKDYRIIEFWGPYSNWELDRDVIVFTNIHALKHKPVLEGSAKYERYLQEREGYKKHVINKGEVCQIDRCYERVMELPGDGEVLVLTKPGEQ